MVNRCCCAVGVLASVLALTGGCGARPTGEVSGKLTFQGEPVARGTIAFVGEDGNVASGIIRDGTYHVVNAPVGTARITVAVHPAPSPMIPADRSQPAVAPAPREKFVPIPQRYQDPRQSGLSYAVVQGRQTYDVILTP